MDNPTQIENTNKILDNIRNYTMTVEDEMMSKLINPLNSQSMFLQSYKDTQKTIKKLHKNLQELDSNNDNSTIIENLYDEMDKFRILANEVFMEQILKQDHRIPENLCYKIIIKQRSKRFSLHSYYRRLFFEKENKRLFINIFLNTKLKNIISSNLIDENTDILINKELSMYLTEFLCYVMNCNCPIEIIDWEVAREPNVLFKKNIINLFKDNLLSYLTFKIKNSEYSIGDCFIEILDFYFKHHKKIAKETLEEKSGLLISRFCKKNEERLKHFKEIIRIICASQNTHFLSHKNYHYLDCLNIHQNLIKGKDPNKDPLCFKVSNTKRCVSLDECNLEKKIIFLNKKYDCTTAAEFYSLAINNLLKQKTIDIDEFNIFLNNLLETTEEKIKDKINKPLLEIENTKKNHNNKPTNQNLLLKNKKNNEELDAEDEKAINKELQTFNCPKNSNQQKYSYNKRIYRYFNVCVSKCQNNKMFFDKRDTGIFKNTKSIEKSIRFHSFPGIHYAMEDVGAENYFLDTATGKGCICGLLYNDQLIPGYLEIGINEKNQIYHLFFRKNPENIQEIIDLISNKNAFKNIDVEDIIEDSESWGVAKFGYTKTEDRLILQSMVLEKSQILIIYSR